MVPELTQKGSVHVRDLSVDVADVQTVESCAARAWPATHMTRLEGWDLRHSPGVANRRANSVLAHLDEPGGSIDARVKKVEGFYGDRALPARFMVSPASVPDTLDRELDRLGYAVEAPTLVQWARTADVVGAGDWQWPVVSLDQPTPGWMATYMEDDNNQTNVQLKTDLIRRIEASHILAQVAHPQGPVAVGLSVFEQGWAGIFCMHTRRQFRRRGLARQVLQHLARWADGCGAERMYLQVEADNAGAQRFYQTAGFVTQYGYHYRTKETARASQ